jgi:hypothetical protein
VLPGKKGQEDARIKEQGLNGLLSTL